MKKAQLQQVFIYIMAILVIGFLVLMGYRAIGGLMNQQCDIKDYTFASSLADHVKSSSRYGAVTEVALDAPCDYDKLCLVDKAFFNRTDHVDPASVAAIGGNDLIYANAIDDIPQNVYLIHKRGGNDGQTEAILWEPSLRVDADPNTQDIEPGYHCVELTTGVFRFWLRGLGKEGVLVLTGN